MANKGPFRTALSVKSAAPYSLPPPPSLLEPPRPALVDVYLRALLHPPHSRPPKPNDRPRVGPTTPMPSPPTTKATSLRELFPPRAPSLPLTAPRKPGFSIPFPPSPRPPPPLFFRSGTPCRAKGY